jgi:hypothetical protein
MRALLLVLVTVTTWACSPDPEACQLWAQTHGLPEQLDMWSSIFSGEGWEGGESAITRGARRDLENACLSGECWPVSKCKDGTPYQQRELERLIRLSR